jgi:hypothetical protein
MQLNSADSQYLTVLLITSRHGPRRKLRFPLSLYRIVDVKTCLFCEAVTQQQLSLLSSQFLPWANVPHYHVSLIPRRSAVAECSFLVRATLADYVRELRIWGKLSRCPHWRIFTPVRSSLSLHVILFLKIGPRCFTWFTRGILRPFSEPQRVKVYEILTPAVVRPAYNILARAAQKIPFTIIVVCSCCRAIFAFVSVWQSRYLSTAVAYSLISLSLPYPPI